MKNALTILITTHVLPTAPSIEIIDKCIRSIFENLEGLKDCNVLIYCDSKKDDPVYRQYLSNLRARPQALAFPQTFRNVQVLDRPHSGLTVNYIDALVNCPTEFVLFCEHDWLFLRPIDVKALINCMEVNAEVNFVRFNKRNNWKVDDASDAWETHIEEEDQIKECPLMRTNSIATHPHVVRRDKFVNDWLPLIETVQGGWSIELSLYVNYTNDIKNMGFTEAHKKWGAFNYGKMSEPYIIRHLDGSDSGRT